MNQYKYSFPQFDNHLTSNENSQANNDFSMNLLENVLKSFFSKIVDLNRSNNESEKINEDFLLMWKRIDSNKKIKDFKKISFTILSISFFISFLIILKLYIDFNHNYAEKNDTMCSSVQCENILKKVLDNVDESIKPCEDFYQYSCGNWIKKYKVKLKSYKLNNFNRFKELSKSNSKFLNELLLNNIPSTNNTQSAFFKVQKYFNICLEDSIIDRSNGSLFLTTIHNFLNEIGGWPLISETYHAKNWNLIDTLITLQSYKIFPFFISMVVSDDINSTINRIAFVENPIRIIKSRNMKLIKKDFIKVVLYFAQLLKSPTLNEKSTIIYHTYAKYIYFFELKLFKIQKSIKTLKSKNEYKALDFDGLRQLFNCKISSDKIHNEFKIDKYLNGIFKNFKNFNEKTQKYFVQSPSYFLQLCSLLSETNNLILANYIGYFALHDLLSVMPFKYRSIKDQLALNNIDQEKKINEGDKKTILRMCAKNTDNAFEFVTGSLFLMHKNLTNLTTEVIRNMTKELKETFVSSIPNLEWMDKQTKKNAIFKAEHMNINVGYPKWIINEMLLNKEYKNVEITDLLFLNELSIRRYSRKKVLKKVLFPSFRSEWNMQPLEVNAYYTQLKNSIGFPIGVLSDPFFNNFALPALNYGSIGNI